MGNVISKVRNELNEVYSCAIGSVIVSALIFLFLAAIIVNIDCPIWSQMCIGFFVSAVVCFICFFQVIEGEKANSIIRMTTVGLICSILSAIAGIVFAVTSVQIPKLILSLVLGIDAVFAIFSCIALYEADIIINQLAKWKLIGISTVSFVCTGCLFSFGYYYFYW